MNTSLLLAHAAATWFMVGLSTTIHWVHYPLFGYVGSRWPAFHHSHTRRMGALLALPWSIEGITALALPFLLTGAARWLALVGLGLLASVAAITVFGAVPAHQRLATHWDAASQARLVRADRVRWALWLCRGALALALLT